MNREAEREAEAARLEAEIAQVCGVLNAATGRLVRLVADVLATGAWQGAGILSPAHWVSWRCGVSPVHARRLVTIAGRLADLPATRAALESGELSEDQAAAVCRHCPTTADASVAEFARHATYSQLARTLARYRFRDEPAEDPPEQRRRVSFADTEEGWWRAWVNLPADEGAKVQTAMEQERRRGQLDSWADALVAVAERALAADQAERGHHDAHTVVVHLHPDGHGQLHLGPALPDALVRQLGCNARVRTVDHRDGVAVSVGRALRIVPERTRLVVETRDGGCRVPGCDRRRWLQLHHVVHWLDGGRTDTANLVALCSHHHRLHHTGAFDIAGDADDPDGLTFTDRRRRRLTGCGRPAPPDGTLITGTWAPPTGERLDSWCVTFDEVPAAG